MIPFSKGLFFTLYNNSVILKIRTVLQGGHLVKSSFIQADSSAIARYFLCKPAAIVAAIVWPWLDFRFGCRLSF